MYKYCNIVSSSWTKRRSRREKYAARVHASRSRSPLLRTLFNWNFSHDCTTRQIRLMASAELAEIEQRPKKKRRFFVDDPDDEPKPILPRSKDGSSRPSSATSQSGHSVSSLVQHVEVAFDAETFKAFIGEDVADNIVNHIRDAAGGNLERAVNMFFDGSWKSTAALPVRQPSPPKSIDGMLRKASARQVSKSARSTPQSSPSPPPQSFRKMPSDRYLGAFGVAAWSTKSGASLISHGEAVRIERSKIAPRTKLGRGGKQVQILARNQKADVITRFTSAKGEEIGRLPEDVAKWVSPLIDQKVCRFEGTCVYAPDRMRVNDTVYLQLKCHMLREGFEAGAFVKPKDDNRVTGIFEEKESSEEKDLRLRQVALVRLFKEINLRPTSINEATAKHKEEGILQAAEMAERYEGKDKTKTNGTSTPQSEEEEGEELEEDQLESLYKKAQTFDFNTPEAEPPDSFVLDLRKYQKQALHWMLTKERKEESGREKSMHPLWEEYLWPAKDADDKLLPTVEDQDHFYVNPYSGEISLDFPVQDDDCLGGILADEMGLGKTIEMYSLMHSNQSDVAQAVATSQLSSVNSLPRLPQTSSSIEPAPCTTLVVAPMSLLAQWESEAVKASKPGTLKSLVYYGSDKSVNLQNICSASNAASAPRVIITSYGTVLSEFNQVASLDGNRGSHGGLFSVDFFRVILDEAHTIKNRQSKTAKACYEISAKHRWVLTGTPIVNRLEDLFSLVRFLKVEPWNNFSYWKTFITVPFESKEVVRALNVVQTVLEPLVMRRTKDMKTPDGEALVPLPSKTINIEEIEMSNTEREVYDFIFNRAKRAFHESVQAGTLMKSYTTIFAQILRLRQSCCHPVLTRNKDIVADEEEAAVAATADGSGFADDMDLQDLISRFETATTDASKENEKATDPINNFTTHALKQIQSESSGECPICTEEPMIDPAVTLCWHSACKKCLEDYIKHQTDKGEVPRCFSCREDINPRDIFEVVKYQPNGETESFESFEDMYTDPKSTQAPPRISLRRIHPLSPSASTSAKIAALLTHLNALPRHTKAVVFSQFTSFLDLISPQLKRHSIHHLRFDGTMSQKVRASILREFTAENASDPKAPRVLLLSLRAGGVGLNLTAASKVFMMDPWWSFAVEAQAIDRIHRMGQTSKVEVVRFIVKESIEGRMLRVQERKMVVAGTLGVGQSGGEGGAEDDKKKRRMEELELLLG